MKEKLIRHSCLSDIGNMVQYWPDIGINLKALYIPCHICGWYRAWSTSPFTVKHVEGVSLCSMSSQSVKRGTEWKKTVHARWTTSIFVLKATLIGEWVPAKYCLDFWSFPGLFTADQKLKGDGSIYTRQNPQGTRRGLECPEERDYYPYWHPTEWGDIAIMTSDTSRCAFYKEESFNVKPRGNYSPNSSSVLARQDGHHFWEITTVALP